MIRRIRAAWFYYQFPWDRDENVAYCNIDWATAWKLAKLETE